jgi:hypothetical protein
MKVTNRERGVDGLQAVPASQHIDPGLFLTFLLRGCA